jgi:hypothetical protein
MKTLLTIVSLVGMNVFIACGPSAEEREAEAKKMQDSVASAEAAKRAAEEAALAQDAIQDSLARLADTTAVTGETPAQ